jgi:polysaccharide export outer membrane protein
LTVWELRWDRDGQGLNLDFNDIYPIDDEGKIQVPVIGEVKVIGYNVRTLADRLRELLTPYFAEPPVVVVEPLIRVTVMGAFNRPGSYLISARRSLWDLVDLAGGPAENANLLKLRVQRSGQVVKDNLLGGYEKGVSLRELGIQSGDQVLMPPRSSFTARDFMDYARFGISLAILYLQIKRTR